MNTTIIIPARYASTRLPGKLLKKIQGKSVLEWVYNACKKADLANRVIIATDHHKIKEAAERFGAHVEITSKNHLSGTSRCIEVAGKINSDYIINVQGDEPFIDPELIDQMIRLFNKNKEISILTLSTPFSDESEVKNPNNVKLVKTKSNRVLYFSRSEIPYNRESQQIKYLKHIGIYGFKTSTLLELRDLASSNLENAEKLEQLNWLESDFDIHVLEVETQSISIDTKADLEKARIYAEGFSR